MATRKTCRLALEDGLVFVGEVFGAEGTATGEVVFNTSMAGYQEVLTDPSYSGQLVTMTYPLIGNYGINAEDVESYDGKVQVAGFVIKELSPVASNFRSTQTLEKYLASAGVMGLTGVDTRALTRHIRTAGRQQKIPIKRRGVHVPVEDSGDNRIDCHVLCPVKRGGRTHLRGNRVLISAHVNTCALRAIVSVNINVRGIDCCAAVNTWGSASQVRTGIEQWIGIHVAITCINA